MFVREDYFMNAIYTVREAMLILDENMRVLCTMSSW